MTLKCYSETIKRTYTLELKGLEQLIDIEIGFHDHKQNGHYYLLIRYSDNDEVLARFNSGSYFHGDLDSKLVDLLKAEANTVFTNGDRHRMITCLNRMPIQPKKESTNGKKPHKKHNNYGTIVSGKGLGKIEV